MDIIDLQDPKNRHPIDSRILILQNMDQFELWRERSQLNENGIHALAFDYTTVKALEKLNQAAKEISEYLLLCKTNRISDHHFHEEFAYTSLTYSIGKDDRSKRHIWLEKEFTENNFSPQTLDILRDFLSVQNTSKNNAEYNFVVRMNGKHPNRFHTHDDPKTVTECRDTIILSLQKSGTIIDSGQAIKRVYDTPIGQKFAMACGWILLMDSTMPHRAPQEELDQDILTETYDDDDHRITFITR